MQKLAIEKILEDNYGLPNPQISSTLETRGDRSAFLVISKNRKLVAKIIPASSSLEKRMETQLRIQKNGFPCPQIFLDIKGNFISNYENKKLVLMEYCTGEESYPSKNNFYELGVITARLHNFGYSGVDLPKFETSHEIDRIRKAFAKNKGLKLTDKEEIAKVLKSMLDFDKIENTLLHRDLSFFNLIQSSKKTFLIDFDNLCLGPYVFDLGHIIAFSCCLIPWDYEKYPMIEDQGKLTFYPGWLEHFVSGYRSKKEIPINEINYIYESTLIECLFNVFDRETNQMIMWNFKRYLEIKNNREIISKILSNR